MSADTTLLIEIRERMVRTESRIVQLGDHVGANLRTKQRIDIEVSDTGEDANVNIDSLDVSLSRIYTEMKDAGHAGLDADVYLDGVHVATLYPKGA
jgi:hypothetical protein